MSTSSMRRFAGAALLLAALVSACGDAAPPSDAAPQPASRATGPAATAEAPLYGITVSPPPAGDGAAPLRFVVRNGRREISVGSVQCHIERIETATMRLGDNTEQAEEFTTLAPGAEHAVHCDPLVFLDPAAGVTIVSARVTVDLEFEVSQVSDRQFARFTFDAARGADGLHWILANVGGGAGAERDR